MLFSMLRIGQTFMKEKSGSIWLKTAPTKAKKTGEDDAVYKVGETAPFSADEEVSVYNESIMREGVSL